MTSTPDTQDIRNAPIALWRTAGAFLRTLFSLFGPPEAIAAQHTMTAKAHKLALSWIRVGEAFVRHLLLIEAAALPRPSTAPRARAPRPRQRRLVIHEMDAPEQWRVSFRCARAIMDRRRPRQPPAHAGETPAGQIRFHSAWPLAERLEAMLRAYNNPAPYARRLARRLYARPVAAQAMRAEPAHFAHRIDEIAYADLRSHAARAARAFADSS